MFFQNFHQKEDENKSSHAYREGNDNPVLWIVQLISL